MKPKQEITTENFLWHSPETECKYINVIQTLTNQKYSKTITWHHQELLWDERITILNYKILTTKCSSVKTWYIFLRYSKYRSDSSFNLGRYRVARVSSEFNLYRDHSKYGLRQWQAPLLCNSVSHWLCPYPEKSLLCDLPDSLQYCTKYHVILEDVIMRNDCTSRNNSCNYLGSMLLKPYFLMFLLVPFLIFQKDTYISLEKNCMK